MSPIFRQAFDGTICTESIRSFTLMFLIMFTISLVGMVMIMTRSAMYPFKLVLSLSSANGVEDEWDEYQAYLRYMASFINVWGGTMADEFSVCSKAFVLKDSLETSITAFGDSSTVSSNNTPPVTEYRTSQRHPRDVTFVDEESIELRIGNEEMKPLSPAESNIGGNRTRRRNFNETQQQNKCDAIDDECTPLTPPPNTLIQSSSKMRNRRPSPNFLRWQRQEDSQRRDEEMYGNPVVELLPETPLMVSPTAPQGRDFFTRFISPIKKGNPDGGKFV
jgi:hypothetical protein